MAKLFGQKPSDLAPLDECVGEIGKLIFNRTIAAFGRAVHVRLDEVSTSSHPTIIQAQRTREWERIMGGTGASAFREIGDGISPNARVVGEDPAADDDEMLGEGWVL